MEQKYNYLLVQDGAKAWGSDIHRGKPEWLKDAPLGAINEF